MGCWNFEKKNSKKVIHREVNVLIKRLWFYIYKVIITNPNDYFNFISKTSAYKTQREVMEFDLNRVRNSDLIIVNFNDMYSLGIMAEIAIVYERKIPVIGLNETKQSLHSWEIEITNRMFNGIYDMLDHVKDFYLSWLCIKNKKGEIRE